MMCAFSTLFTSQHKTSHRIASCRVAHSWLLWIHGRVQQKAAIHRSIFNFLLLFMFLFLFSLLLFFNLRFVSSQASMCRENKPAHWNESKQTLLPSESETQIWAWKLTRNHSHEALKTHQTRTWSGQNAKLFIFRTFNITVIGAIVQQKQLE